MQDLVNRAQCVTALTAAHQSLHWSHLDPIILRSYIAHCEQITTEEYDNNTLMILQHS